MSCNRALHFFGKLWEISWKLYVEVLFYFFPGNYLKSVCPGTPHPQLSTCKFTNKHTVCGSNGIGRSDVVIHVSVNKQNSALILVPTAYQKHGLLFLTYALPHVFLIFGWFLYLIFQIFYGVCFINSSKKISKCASASS